MPSVIVKNRRNFAAFFFILQIVALNFRNSISTQEELDDFRDMLAHYFAEKAQKAIDELWGKGEINDQTIEEWGNEHMRTTYRNN